MDFERNSEGWSMFDARSRVAPPSLTRLYKESAGTRAALSTQFQIGSHEFEDERARLQKVIDRADRQFNHGLIKCFIEEKLYAWGSQDQLSNPRIPIFAKAWPRIDAEPYKDFVTLNNLDNTQTIFHSVLVYAPVHDPLAYRKLAGVNLLEAFHYSVIDDPEVHALHLREDDTLETYFPSRYLKFRWHLRDAYESICEDFGYKLAFEFKEMWRSRRQAQAAGERCEAMLNLFRSGTLLALGRQPSSTSAELLEPSVWKNDKFCVDFSRCCIVDRSDDNVIWEEIYVQSLVQRELVGVDASTSIKVAASPYPVPKSTAEINLRNAAVAIWPEGVPEGFPKKSRDRRLLEWLTERGLPAVSERTIRRYFGSEPR